ncbi:YqgE/AlgH family protein [Litoribacter ruber]|uniref:YqgE/AlgH family protein n=1 Tax=Litoribacter ruber TaxID=702568 RepID=A0AAP2G501_9BACT|nr:MULTISPECIES: YqgE/AlgH family protein [Litoribacter]MBS9524571.1 YqgE/AlgH family protein [Litoribacter alkaliphilus]MBT0810269.1 YqgE/AlgH family protein [Litoribacter ruber]
MGLTSNKSPVAGDLLISEPFLQDENFVRSVILLCEHNEKGSFGLVLNKLSIVRLGDLIQDLSSYDTSVYVGGPVEQNTLHFIYHGDQLITGSIPLAPDIWWSGNFTELVDKLKTSDLDVDKFRFFLGYSGWSEGQLQEEIDLKTWIVCPSELSQHIFNSDPDELWKIILKNMGGEYQLLANYPIDPRLN